MAAVAAAAHPMTGAPSDHDPLLELCRDARLVLLGQASHGAHEFYRQRALIRRRLIVEHGFGAVVVEADWPTRTVEPLERVGEPAETFASGV